MHESLLKPPRLKQGATIGVIAPSSFPYYPEFSLFQGLEHLKKLGYKVVLGQTLRKSLAQGYHSASDEERAQELNWAFRDSSIDAVFCARGGVGSLRILKMIDYDLIKKNPKIFVGYSDTTSIQNAFLSRSSLVSVQGPMVAVGFGKNSDTELTKYYWSTLFEMLKGEALELGAWLGGPIPLTIKEGKAKGRVIGGNLILFSLIASSEFCVPPLGKILFLEDIKEEAWRIDNFLSSLEIKGVLNEIEGAILGEFPQGEELSNPSVEQVLRSHFSQKPYPSFVNYPCCHGFGREPIPLGVQVEMDADLKKVSMLETLVD
jgi:muramoyltetrapeptide carboxypeptidase